MAHAKRLESQRELNHYDSPRVEATTPNPISQNIQNRLSKLLSHLPKLNVTGFVYRPLDTFTLFPNLPIELRLKIWNYTTRQSRTLLLTDTWYSELAYLNKMKLESIENNNKVPAVLHTCSEARQEGLKHYIACAKRCPRDISIRAVLGHSCEKKDCVSKRVYINFDDDRFLCRKFPAPQEGLGEDTISRRKLRRPLALGPLSTQSNSLGGRLQNLNIVVKEHTWAWQEPLLPNTVDRELIIKQHEKELMENIGSQMRWDLSVYKNEEEDEGCIDWQFPKGIEVACVWSWIAEEYDLVPISVGASAGYVAAGGVQENNFDTQREGRPAVDLLCYDEKCYDTSDTRF